jgi:hypothetical protein
LLPFVAAVEEQLACLKPQTLAEVHLP